MTAKQQAAVIAESLLAALRIAAALGTLTNENLADIATAAANNAIGTPAVSSRQSGRKYRSASAGSRRRARLRNAERSQYSMSDDYAARIMVARREVSEAAAAVEERAAEARRVAEMWGAL